MKYVIATYLVILTILFAAAFVRFDYTSNLNAGFGYTAFGHCIGYETRGVPGIFVDVDCR